MGPEQMVQSIILVGSKTRNQLLVLVKMDSASRATVVIKTLTSFVQVIIGPTFTPVPAKTGVITKQESLVANSSGTREFWLLRSQFSCQSWKWRRSTLLLDCKEKKSWRCRKQVVKRVR